MTRDKTKGCPRLDEAKRPFKGQARKKGGGVGFGRMKWEKCTNRHLGGQKTVKQKVG